jgi:hypothetical protein
MGLGKAAKAWVAVVGAGVTAALGLAAPHSVLWDCLTVAAAIITGIGTYSVRNAPQS